MQRSITVERNKVGGRLGKLVVPAKSFASALKIHSRVLLEDEHETKFYARGVGIIREVARPTKDRRWERALAEVYSDAIGSSVVVANSLVIAEIMRHPTPVGTAIAIAPGHAAVGHSSERTT